MNLNLKKPLLFFDIESTGLNIPTDSIAQLSFVKIFPMGPGDEKNPEKLKTWTVCPWDYEKKAQRPVAPAAKAVNKLEDSELAKCPKFYEIVDEVISWMNDADLAGFNSSKFDLPMLAEEIERVRHFMNRNDITIDLRKKTMIDVQTIYHYKEPRNLKAAHLFYCHSDFDNAHNAEADTYATYEVLKGQLDMYSDLQNDVQALSMVGNERRQEFVDFDGKLIRNRNGEAVINFGKHKGKTAREVYKTEPSYFAWIAQGTFSEDTKRQFQLLKEEFDADAKKPLGKEELDSATLDLMRHFGGVPDKK
jgi:DNA polymerase-3 subunit epsilon